jgi:ATP-dependent Clp protease ATP-binding subunit ClpX
LPRSSKDARARTAASCSRRRAGGPDQVRPDPEFVGRLPVVATLEELDEEALIDPDEPKNALTKQYRSCSRWRASSSSSARTRCAPSRSKAMQRKTGARGLRTILENVLLDTMYDLPSLRNVQKVVVDEA